MFWCAKPALGGKPGGFDKVKVGVVRVLVAEDVFKAVFVRAKDDDAGVFFFCEGRKERGEKWAGGDGADGAAAGYGGVKVVGEGTLSVLEVGEKLAVVGAGEL